MGVFKKSTKTSLLDLTLDELKSLAYWRMDLSEFIDEIQNPKFIARMRYVNPQFLRDWIEDGIDNTLHQLSEETLTTLIHIRNSRSSRGRWYIDGSVFSNGRQLSMEFIEANVKNIYPNHLNTQKCITPEFLESIQDKIDEEHFFERFVGLDDNDTFKAFVEYKDGHFARWVMSSRKLRYKTKDDLAALGLPSSPFHETVIDFQRIMSGNPCDDGQRSFTIWLRKYRRVCKDPDGFPTWNQMLELLKDYPRLNNSGYVDWIHSRCLFNSDETVNEYPMQLSYQPKNIDREDYAAITTGDLRNESAQADYEIEFADVVAHQEAQRQANERERQRYEESQTR